MPWPETSPMEDRMDLVREYASGLFTMTDLAAQYGVSRKTGYKWVDRHAGEGLAGLADRSRRPHASPQATDSMQLNTLIRLRRRHPHWGAKKFLVVVARQTPDTDWPCAATVTTHLKAAGLIRARRRRPRPAPMTAARRPPITVANEVWTTDFKGEFLTGERRYCYPFTLR